MLKMKTSLVIIMVFCTATVFCAATILCATTAFGAERNIYTWTDERGNLHMTDEPPPANAKVKEVETYQDKSPEEIEALERTQLEQEDKRRFEDLQAEVNQAQRDAAKAEQNAAAATEYAQKLTQEAQEYVRRFGNTPERRKKFKYKIQAKKDEALAAQDAALEARAMADQAKLNVEAKLTAAEKAASQPAPPEEPELRIDE